MIFYLVSTSSLILSSSVEFMQAKPGCQLKCGNVTIPYPFGIGKECSIFGSEGSIMYDIICDNSYDPPKPFMNATYSYLEILSVSETEVRIRNSFTEFNGGAFMNPMEPDRVPSIKDIENRTNADGYLDLVDTPFMVSHLKNKFYGIGCGLVSVIIADVTRPRGFIIKECQSSCENISKDGACSGSGCCQTTVPKGLESFSVGVLENATKSTVGPFSNSGNFSSFAVLAELGKFTFDSVDLALDATKISKKYEDKVIPVVLDWSIGFKTCEDAKVNSTTYACQGNSHCTNKITGYVCTCPDGYEGNPYLKPGCDDVNECDGPNTNTCTHICINTIGSYSCTCPDDSFGDGRKDGLGCIPREKEFPVSMVALGNLLADIPNIHRNHSFFINLIASFLNITHTN
ncbi:hypothetical protein MKW92_025141, partial [Papaver armeniacum]